MKEQRLRLDWKRCWISFVFCLPFVCAIGQQTIQIVDADGMPLIGVQMFDEEASNIWESNLDGEITISTSLEEPITLETNYLGYETQRIVLDKNSAFPIKLVLQSSDILLEEVMIVGRNNVKKSNIIGKVETISSKEIKSLQVQNSADVLSQSGEVFVQKSQYGGGSPIMRGFEANKLLLVIDGVRMNNAIYRNGHLQNAITVDHQSLQQLELLFGPGSLIYGSDALGGVIHFRTKTPAFIENGSKTSLNVVGGYNTVNNGFTSHLDYTLQRPEFSSYSSLSFNSFGDLRSGRSNRPTEYPEFGLRPDYVSTINGVDSILQNTDPSIQIGSGYSQFDIQQKLSFKLGKAAKAIANIQYSGSTDVPRYDALIERSDDTLRFSEWNYGPQNRLLLSAKLAWNLKKPFADHSSLLVAYQRIDEDRITRRYQSLSREHNEEDVNVSSVNLDFRKVLPRSFSIHYGADFQHNTVISSAYSENIISSVQSNDILSRYADGTNRLWNAGLYFKTDWYSKNEALKLSGGVRQTIQQMFLNYEQSTQIEWPDFYYQGIESNTGAFVWNVYGRYNIQRSSIRMGLGTAFRAPNIDDLAKVRVNGNEITIPNPDLNPEKTQNIEFAYEWTSKHQSFQVVVYQALLNDAIVRESFSLPDGSTTFEVDGEDLQVTANVNADRARIQGSSIQLASTWTEKLRSRLSINITEGQIINEDGASISPLGHIPPIFSKASVDYTMKSFEFGLSHLFFAAKDINDFGGSVDNPDLATPEGSLSYHLVNARLNYQPIDLFSISLGVDNVLDQFYRPFASGVNGGGRNFKLSLSVHL